MVQYNEIIILFHCIISYKDIDNIHRLNPSILINKKNISICIKSPIPVRVYKIKKTKSIGIIPYIYVGKNPRRFLVFFQYIGMIFA
jgi:hypothetical protein